MKITPIKAFTDNYIWAFIDTSLQTLDCVDPGDAEPVLAYLQAHHLTLRTLWLTHHHSDHIGGVKTLHRLWPDITIYAPIDTRIPIATHRVREDELLSIGNMQFKVLSNPGHTSTHISYFELNNKWLFCGDTLFSAGCGRVFDGTLTELFQSLQLFNALPEDTQIFCAHEYTRQNLQFAHHVEPNNISVIEYINELDRDPTRCTLPSVLQKERLINPFLRIYEEEVQHFAKKNGAQSLEPLEIFRILREKKNTFTG